MTTIELIENGQPVEVALDDRTGLALRSSELVTAAPSVHAGWWVIGPRTKVGVARIAGVDLTIRPKVNIRRLMFLIGYARDGSLWRDEDVDLEEDADLLKAIASAFARQAERATSHGLLHGYRVEELASPVLRGRIRTSDQLTRRHGMALPLEIRFDEFDVDIAENQILRAATDRLLRLERVPDRTRRALRRLSRELADVSPLPRGGMLPAWTRSRLNARYHVALGLGELVLRGSSVEQAAGTVRIDGFMLDMAKLFEDFLTEALGAALLVAGGRVRAQDRWHLDEATTVPMKPDLVWYGPESATPTAVIDAKYKAEKPSGYPNADLYQMLAYCTVRGLRRGHLVYAKGNEPEARHRVVGTGVEIYQHALDLGADPATLLDQVHDLATLVTRLAATEDSLAARDFAAHA
ncbi:McrC family protein [Cellulomonas sp. ACRRI]|uniref:McrC family protein n=1 Tax=Cellulomonas sp. ACRRI TaxID=2918188 RepID=UPI001EF26815|nr:McrC family protein [Cellulomonas sp. ACRRI]MCG7285448.1 McrC family protein [Cellulomonas sp. ACRRI]